jgi:hypothetical protein
MDNGKTSRIASSALRTAARVLAAWCCLVAISPFAPATAQSSNAVRCSYESRSDVASALRSLHDSDEPTPTHLAAAAALGQIGKDALPALMAAIPEYMRHNAESNAWPEKERDFAIVVTDVIRVILSGDHRAILRFRECTTDAIIKPLTWAARGDNQRLRVNAANILANVIDNTTVCFVLHHLRDANISPSGRANLLGVTNSMASYAYKENVASIKNTIENVTARIGSSLGFDQAKSIIGDIYARMAKSENKDKSVEAVSLKKYCGDYDFNAAID